MKRKHPLTLLLNRQKGFVGVYLTFFILIQTYVVDTHNVCFERKKKSNEIFIFLFFSLEKKNSVYCVGKFSQ